MMVMTAKVDKKKIAVIAAVVVGLILAIVLLFNGGDNAAETAASTVSGNDSRVAFLKEMGWDVTETPVQSGQVKIPDAQSEVFDRYNAMQKSQGYDLSQFAGKTVMRYVYQVNNYPGATDPVYATLLVYKNQIIGGDVTNTAAKGQIQGLRKQVADVTPSTVPETTVPTESKAA
ncbi:MAG: DUF4830 domain-containing protein [Oscillospiraceae bacterium]|nr:DUF4830 domain-containing protein [Oscillospiraceae bacterium]